MTHEKQSRADAEDLKFTVQWFTTFETQTNKKDWTELCRMLVFQGTSTKYSPQRVGLTHIMEHEDVIQIVKK